MVRTSNPKESIHNSYIQSQERLCEHNQGERNLETVVKAFGNSTNTCILTQKAYLFGGTNDDSFVDVTIDSSGMVYAAGNTYSPSYTSGEQDIAVFQFDASGDFKWGRYWGSSLSETATAIALDEGEQFFYVSGYSNSVGTLSISKIDMFVLKFSIATGLITWARRIGYDNNDKANGITHNNGFVYVVGESDSTGYTNAKTDIMLIKLDQATGAFSWMKYIGGTQEDTGLIVICDNDDSVYTLGQGYSVELTYGTLDLFLIKQNSDGSLGYFYNFGGTNPDYASDMKMWVNQLYITGYSQSITLTNGFLDIFVLSVSKSNPTTTTFVKYIGTNSFSEISKGLTVLTDGSFFLMGQISANGFTNGNNDVLVASMTKDGKTNFVEYMGSTISETPGDIVYNSVSKQVNAFINSNSVSFKNQGGSDWMVFVLDPKGRNQCTALNIVNSTTTLLFKDSTARFRSMTSAVTLKNVVTPTSGTITNVGVIQTLNAVKQTFCQKFGPIINEEGINDTTVIENTYMTYVVPTYCDDQTAALTYTLTKSTGSAVDSWMIWDGTVQTLQGLVPQAKSAYTELTMTGTDADGLTTSTNFKVYFVSKPYLNKALKNYQIRTDQLFYYQIPEDTFLHPNNLKISYLFYSYPSWMAFTNSSMTFQGRPKQVDVGTYTILVTGTDTKNETATATFQVDVQKNYFPVVQKQVDDQQIDLDVGYSFQFATDTFVDPNGDKLTYKASGLPSWMKFDNTTRKLTGTPTSYGSYIINITASDSWNGTTTMSYNLVAGIRPNTSPYASSRLTDQTAYRKQLFQYKLPESAFKDDDNDTLYYLISQPDGEYIPNWLTYEDFTRILSGFPNENATTFSVQVIADDRRGGSAYQSFTVNVDSLDEIGQNYLYLIIVILLLLAFIIGVTIIVCRKNLKCGKKNKSTPDGEDDSDDDSYEEDDDICIEDAKPKNPFAFKREMEAKASDDKYRNERFKFYGSQVPAHAKTREKVSSTPTPGNNSNTTTGQQAQEGPRI
eukprot:403367090